MATYDIKDVQNKLQNVIEQYEKCEFRCLNNSLHYSAPDMARHTCERMVVQIFDNIRRKAKDLHLLNKLSRSIALVITHLQETINRMDESGPRRGLNSRRKSDDDIKQEWEESKAVYSEWIKKLQAWHTILNPMTSQENDIFLWQSIDKLTNIVHALIQ